VGFWRSHFTAFLGAQVVRILQRFAGICRGNRFIFFVFRASVITSKAANGYHFKTGQQKWPSRTEIVLPCRLLWWQVGFGAPAPRATLEHVSVVQ